MSVASSQAEEFAREACSTGTSRNLKAGGLADILLALRKELRRVFPALSEGEANSLSVELLVVRCPVCGQLSESVVQMMIIGSAGAFGGAIFGGPNVASAYSGHCPICGGTELNVSFSPDRVRARISSGISMGSQQSNSPVGSLTQHQFELGVEPASETIAGLTQWQRLGDAFAAPAKTFEDIQRGNRSWWLPFLIAIVLTYVLFAAIALRIGWPQVAQNAVHFNPKSEARLAQLPDPGRARAMQITQDFIEGVFLLSPLLVLLIALIASLVLVGTINFVFGGRAAFGSVFAVWFYATLPGAIKALLGIVVIFAGLAPDSFNLNNFAPTNVGAFLNPLDTGAALYRLASGLDVTTLWSVALLSIGLATVAGVKRSSGYIAVFGWWALILLVSVGWAAAFS